MRVLIVRAQGDAEATAGALRARGHSVAAHPLVAVEATDEAPPNLTAAQAFIVTDADGARALANAVGVRTFPVFCDGDASAAELARLGFTDVRNAHGDAGALAKVIEKSLSPKLGALIYVCSTSAPINLSAMLNNAGFSVRMSALYAVKRAEALPPALQQELRVKAFDAAVFFSPDEARAFAQLVQRAELDAAVRPLIAVVASPVVAAPLTVLKFARIVSAPKADADSVVAMVDDALLPKLEAKKPEAPKPEAQKPELTKPQPVATAKPAPAPPPFIAPHEIKPEPKAEPKAPETPAGPGVLERLGTTIKARWQRAREERTAELARREAERPERERIAAEQREQQRIEAERLRAERAEAAKRAEERFVQDRAEQARREVERREQARLEAEDREQQRLEQQRVERERREAELEEMAQAEAERRQMTQEEWARREQERALQLRQKLEHIETERIERARQHKEKQEAARREKERLAAERRKQEQLAAEAARIEAERLRAERAEAAKLAEERFAQEQAERARREVERREQERQQAEDREQQRLEQQRLDKERREAELLEIARAEAERRQMTQEEWARREQERAEQLRQELARSEQERLERARQEKARQEAIRREKERLEAERREREKQDAERREKERQDAERREKERRETERLNNERLENERREKERIESQRAGPPHGAVEIELAPMPEVPALGAAVVAAAAFTVLEPPRVSGLAPTSAAPSPVTEPALEEQSLPALDAEDARIAAALETPGENAGLFSRLRNLVTRKRPPPPAPQDDGLRARPETTAPPSAPPAGASEIELRIDAASQPLDAAALAPLAQDRTVLTPPATPDLPEIPSASPQEPGLPQPEMIPMVDLGLRQSEMIPMVDLAADLAALAEAAAAPPHSPPISTPPISTPPMSKQAVAAVVEESMKEETPLATMAPPAEPADNQKPEPPQTDPMSPPDDHGQDQAPEQAPEQAKPAPAGPRGGGRAARLLAEDAADARALNQRFRVGSADTDATAETPVEDAAAPQTYKKQSSAGRRFAMFVIAVIVVAGGILFSAPWWAPQIRSALQVVAPETAAPAPATPTLEQVTALQARAEALAADVTALNARLAAVEQRPAPAATDGAVLAALTERVKALESRPSTGATASPEGLADSVVNQARQLTNVTARVATLEAAIGNVARLEDVATRLGALEGRSAEANSVLALGERIAALEKRDQIAATALVLATAQLRAAVNAGRAYAIELETVNQLAARASVTFNAEPLASRASTGAPRAEALTAAFPAVAAATVRAGAAPDTNAPWLRRVLDRALSVFSIRPVGAPEGPSVGAVVARAETALTSGDLAGAVKELEALSGAPATAAAEWLGQAKAKVAADSALNELAARSVGAMGSSTAAKTSTTTGAPP